MGLHFHLSPACPPHHAKCAKSCAAEHTAGETIICEPFTGDLKGLCSCAHWTAIAKKRAKKFMKKHLG
jgi:hypothetical protein